MGSSYHLSCLNIGLMVKKVGGERAQNSTISKYLLLLLKFFSTNGSVWEGTESNRSGKQQMLDLGKWVIEMFLPHLVMWVCFSLFFFLEKEVNGLVGWKETEEVVPSSRWLSWPKLIFCVKQKALGDWTALFKYETVSSADWTRRREKKN